jgi:phosphohistidine phosphatase
VTEGTTPRPRARRAASTKPAPPTGGASGAAAEAPSADAPAAGDVASAADVAAAAEPRVDGPGGIELYFLRHADAGNPAAWPGDDADRPLSAKGKRQSKRLGRLLRDLGFEPDVLITSPKLRAADTARIVGRAIGAEPTGDDRLASGLDPGTLGEVLGELDSSARRVMLVGHDPDFSSLVSWLVGARITLRKGALARTDVDGSAVAAGRASLRWLLPPDAVAG